MRSTWNYNTCLSVNKTRDLLGLRWALLGLCWGLSWALLGHSCAFLGSLLAFFPFGAAVCAQHMELTFHFFEVAFLENRVFFETSISEGFHVLRTDRRTRGKEAKALVNAKVCLLHA